uniref:Uncharacterized protein n=1 Tax=Pseudictyota dubia TaxID=2749911 RepID=A0A7R9Z8I7_9STRA|mmetsp:Transcript_28245/g.52591  ORF Transcript_28245/g.52591 Transcript_28245/m.52591 type:complete len:182 (+) Transcript_28245:138-683(+)|eukprot:CAMPEP_0197447776 /NCGR_PEP_ID=MMETSP1175-20131217/14727_1 /TAXON_ID=1003142 /ORGANISM="Triceratium dubium, Strain CCMP147" /LENGTH=181 /DNA_ID=CAMNT_0042979259 /DNA_START=138 /DNA_END=683 /DNA_ORIENTATION=+
MPKGSIAPDVTSGENTIPTSNKGVSHTKLSERMRRVRAVKSRAKSSSRSKSANPRFRFAKWQSAGLANSSTETGCNNEGTHNPLLLPRLRPQCQEPDDSSAKPSSSHKEVMPGMFRTEKDYKHAKREVQSVQRSLRRAKRRLFLELVAENPGLPAKEQQNSIPNNVPNEDKSSPIALQRGD